MIAGQSAREHAQMPVADANANANANHGGGGGWRQRAAEGFAARPDEDARDREENAKKSRAMCDGRNSGVVPKSSSKHLSKAEKPCALAWTTTVFRGLLVRSHALS